MSDEKVNIEELIRKYVEHIKKLLDELPLADVAKKGEMEVLDIPSDDGVKLKTWLFFPEGMEGPFPTIAVRCCYKDQAEMLKWKAEAFNRKGFGFAVQWCRGTGGSEGEWVPNINERMDGLSFMRALDSDPRVKNIGYWGDSYLALTGWCMADAVPEKVKTMFLGVYGCFRHVSAYKDGLFRQDILTDWAMNNAGTQVSADYLESASFRPQVEVDEKLWGIKLPWYRDWITHTDGNDPYWDEGFWGELKKIPEKVNIPVFVKEGWYDHHLGSAIRTWEALSDETKRKSVFEIGPWNHSYMPCIEHQSTADLEDGSMSEPLLWFDKILRCESEPEGEVKLYRIGSDKWDILKTFPNEREKEKLLYLDADTRKLLEETPSKEGKTEFIFDPADPLFTKGAESTFHSMQENGSHPQPEPDYRDDVVTFMSEPLTEDLHICGKIGVKLSVSSDAEDTAFSVKISEVFDDGGAFNVRGSITTMGYRNGTPNRITYNAGQKEDILIDTWDIDWMFKAGSRIRLDISSSDFPQYSVHSNYAGVWSLQKETKKARQTIYTGAGNSSCVILPVV